MYNINLFTNDYHEYNSNNNAEENMTANIPCYESTQVKLTGADRDKRQHIKLDRSQEMTLTACLKIKVYEGVLSQTDPSENSA